MDILHTVIIQTLKPILVKDKPRSFLHAVRWPASTCAHFCSLFVADFFFLVSHMMEQVAKEGSFIRQIIQILPLCGLSGFTSQALCSLSLSLSSSTLGAKRFNPRCCCRNRSSPDGELTALRPPVKEIMNSLTRTSLSDPELTSLLDGTDPSGLPRSARCSVFRSLGCGQIKAGGIRP